jgi:hypothetical protein
VWWLYVIVGAVLLSGIYAFLTLTGFETRVLTRRTTRTAEDLYPNYADSLRKQRRYAQQHSGESANDGTGSRELKDTQP